MSCMAVVVFREVRPKAVSWRTVIRRVRRVFRVEGRVSMNEVFLN